MFISVRLSIYVIYKVGTSSVYILGCINRGVVHQIQIQFIGFGSLDFLFSHITHHESIRIFKLSIIIMLGFLHSMVPLV